MKEILPNGSIARGPLLASSSQNEALPPGPIVPDGNGGILAIWTISPSNPPVLQFPYQAVDVVGGAVGMPYNLPFSPPSVTFGDSPTIVLGENSIAFATDGSHTDPLNQNDGPKVISFNVSSGAVNWTYQAKTASSLSVIAADANNGIAINDSQNGIIQLDGGGIPSQISAVAGTPETSVDGSWYLETPQFLSKLLLTPLSLAQSYWAFPGGSQFANGGALDQVQTLQPQGPSKQLPANGTTLNTNYNSIEILTTQPASYIFQHYPQTLKVCGPELMMWHTCRYRQT